MGDATRFSQILLLRSQSEVEWWMTLGRAQYDNTQWNARGEPISRVATILRNSSGSSSRILGFCADIEDTPGGRGKSLWLHSEGPADIQQLLNLVRTFFREMRAPDDDSVFVISWCEDSPVPKVDAYGGGAALVTRNDIRQMSTWSWVSTELHKEAEAIVAKRMKEECTPSAQNGTKQPSSSQRASKRKRG